MAPNIAELRGGFVHDTEDALVVETALRQGVIKPVPRRLSRSEKWEVRSGRIYAYYEKAAHVKRWTDGRRWSESRILKNGLIYMERSSSQQGPAPPPGTGKALACLAGSWRKAHGFHYERLLRKTITVHLTGPDTLHIVSYYTARDVARGAVVPLHNHPLLHGIEPDPQALTMLHTYRFPPRVSLDEHGVPHFSRESGARCTIDHTTGIAPPVMPPTSIGTAVEPPPPSAPLPAAPAPDSFRSASSGGAWWSTAFPLPAAYPLPAACPLPAAYPLPAPYPLPAYPTPSSSSSTGSSPFCLELSGVSFAGTGIYGNDLWPTISAPYFSPPAEALDFGVPYEQPLIDPTGYAPLDQWGVYPTYPIPDYPPPTGSTYPPPMPLTYPPPMALTYPPPMPSTHPLATTLTYRLPTGLTYPEPYLGADGPMEGGEE